MATLVHAILAVREVTNEGDGTGHVPGIAVVTAFVLVLLSSAVLVIYVHHIGQALRVSALIELVGKDTRKLLDRVYPTKRADRGAGAGLPAGGGSPGVRRDHGHRHAALVEEARRAGCVLELVPAQLTVRSMTWDAYVHLAFDEIRMVGAGSPQVSRRLRAALTDLRAVATQSASASSMSSCRCWPLPPRPPSPTSRMPRSRSARIGGGWASRPAAQHSSGGAERRTREGAPRPP